MNFEMAADMARDEGIKVAQVVVNDDVAVKDSLYTVGRRGVAGTVFVHKIAGRVGGDGLDALIDLVGGGGGKHGPGHRRVQHALAHIAAVGGLAPTWTPSRPWPRRSSTTCAPWARPSSPAPSPPPRPHSRRGRARGRCRRR